MKKFYLIAMILCVNSIHAQVGINQSEPKSTLHIDAINTDGSTAEGVIVPKLTGDIAMTMLGNLTAAENSMLIYVTEAVSTRQPEDQLSLPGYYRYQYIADDGNGNEVKRWLPLEPSGLMQVQSANATDGLPSFRLIKKYSDKIPTESIGEGAIDISLQNDAEVGAKGKQSIAIGNDVSADGQQVISIGNFVHPEGKWSTSIGHGIVNVGNEGVALGYSHVEGRSSFGVLGNANGDFSVAIGTHNVHNNVYGAFGDRSVAIGVFSWARGNHSLAMLGGSTLGDDAVAIGQNAYSAKKYGFAVGDGARAMGEHSTAFVSAETHGYYSFGFGIDGTVTRNYGSFSLGSKYVNDSEYDLDGSNKNDLTKQLFALGYLEENVISVLRNGYTGIGIVHGLEVSQLGNNIRENYKPTEMLDVNGNVKVRGTGAAITDGNACTNNGTISYAADGNFYGCTGNNVWKKLNN